MDENLLYSNVSCELLEILSHFENSLKEKIPQKIFDSLEEKRNKEYIFKLDESKDINDQKLLKETREILSMIYLKYCCSEEEANNILDESNKLLLKREEEAINNIFTKKEERPKIIENNSNEQLLDIQNISWIEKIKNKVRNFFAKIFGKEI